MHKLKGKQKREAIKRAMAKKNTRVKYCKHDKYIFAMHYFPNAFSCKSAKFHKVWAEAFEGNEHLLIIAFRESAKSFWAMVDFIHCIAYKTRRNMFYVCYDKATANERLFDIANALQTNKELIDDFGHLFPTFAKGSTGPVKRAITQFITTNGIRCKALSLKGKMRGSVFLTKEGMFRPDYLTLDDIDVEDSVRSVDQIDLNYQRLRGEVFGGLADNAKIVCVGNIIRNDGLVIRLEKDNKFNKKWVIYREPVEKAGVLTWPERFTKTREKGKIDLQEKRKTQGEIAYNQNFLLIGYAGGDSIIKRHYIKYERIADKRDFERIIIGIDPSYSEKTQSDNFAIVVTGHKGTKRHVLECVKLSGMYKDIPKSIPIIKSLYIKWRATYVNVEYVTQAFIAKACKADHMATQNIVPGKDKVSRLMEYQGDIESGEVVFNPDNQGVCDLVENLIQFPNVSYDDDVDAMVYSFIKPRKRAV